MLTNAAVEKHCMWISPLALTMQLHINSYLRRQHGGHGHKCPCALIFWVLMFITGSPLWLPPLNSQKGSQFVQETLWPMAFSYSTIYLQSKMWPWPPDGQLTFFFSFTSYKAKLAKMGSISISNLQGQNKNKRKWGQQNPAFNGEGKRKCRAKCFL